MYAARGSLYTVKKGSSWPQVQAPRHVRTHLVQFRPCPLMPWTAALHLNCTDTVATRPTVSRCQLLAPQLPVLVQLVHVPSLLLCPVPWEGHRRCTDVDCCMQFEQIGNCLCLPADIMSSWRRSFGLYSPTGSEPHPIEGKDFYEFLWCAPAEHHQCQNSQTDAPKLGGRVRIVFVFLANPWQTACVILR